jgi:DNA-binding IclR family transcriptional regulator
VIEASGAQLAEQVGTTQTRVSRALSRLAEIGALIRTDRGRYALNPAVAGSGTLASREQAAQRSGPRLVDEPA